MHLKVLLVGSTHVLQRFANAKKRIEKDVSREMMCMKIGQFAKKRTLWEVNHIVSYGIIGFPNEWSNLRVCRMPIG